MSHVMMLKLYKVIKHCVLEFCMLRSMNCNSCLSSHPPRSQGYSFVPCSLELSDSNFVLFCFGWEFHSWISCVLINSTPILFPPILTLITIFPPNFIHPSLSPLDVVCMYMGVGSWTGIWVGFWVQIPEENWPPSPCPRSRQLPIVSQLE